MAIVPTGTKQKTYYVREDLARIIAMIASRHDRRESDVVTEALKQYVKHTLTAEELRVFGYRDASQVEAEVVVEGSLPGTKKRAKPRRAP